MDELLPPPRPRPTVRYSELPYVLPLVEQSGAPVPHVVVVVDRTGGDLRTVDRNGRVVTAESVEGEGLVHEAGAGGQTQRSKRRPSRWRRSPPGPPCGWPRTSTLADGIGVLVRHT